MEYTFIDIETTGLEPENSHIISLGGIYVRDGKTIDNFFTYVKCPVPLCEEVTKVTGIYNEHLVGAPEIDEALKMFLSYCTDSTIVCYNMPFADKFLSYYEKKCGLNYNWNNNEKIHVLPIVKEKLGEELKRNGSLSFLRHVADYFGIPHYLNDCLSQAILLSKVYEKLEVNL